MLSQTIKGILELRDDFRKDEEEVLFHLKEYSFDKESDEYKELLEELLEILEKLDRANNLLRLHLLYDKV